MLTSGGGQLHISHLPLMIHKSVKYGMEAGREINRWCGICLLLVGQQTSLWMAPSYLAQLSTFPPHPPSQYSHPIFLTLVW